ncbi:MAG: hypothetical protein U9Q07_04265 [Planctomycetota bacterium]|nr:hypothetical protein [Planctomycetota bacterium]
MATLHLTLPPSTLTALGGALPTVGVQAQPPVILADYIDPDTRDFASMLSTLDQIDAQVVIAITTKRGSGAAVMDVGHKLHEIKKIRESIQTDITAEMTRALKRLVTNGDITMKPIDFLSVDPGTQQVDFMIKWKNKRSGALQSVRLLMKAA